MVVVVFFAGDDDARSSKLNRTGLFGGNLKGYTSCPDEVRLKISTKMLKHEVFWAMKFVLHDSLNRWPSRRPYLMDEEISLQCVLNPSNERDSTFRMALSYVK